MFQIYGPRSVHELMPTKSPIKPLGVDKLDAIDPLLPVEEKDHNHASPERARQQQVSETYRAIEALPKDVPIVEAQQIMSSPLVSIPPQASILDALRQFQSHGFRHLPVALPTGRLVGIVSERDILRHLARLAMDREAADSRLADTKVQQLMTPSVLTATVDTDVRYIARVFVLQRIGAMPLVDAGGIAQGIICRSDLLRAVMQHYALELWA